MGPESSIDAHVGARDVAGPFVTQQHGDHARDLLSLADVAKRNDLAQALPLRLFRGERDMR